VKRLLLLRHAKAVPAAPGVEDHDRGLLPRGRQDALKVGRYLANEDLEPEVILASTSRRTAETTDLLTGELSGTRRIDYLEGLYLAEPEIMLSIVRLAPDSTKSLMVVGHNPGLEHLATSLAREPVKRKERDRFEAIGEKFPTAALAVLEFDVMRWRDVAAGEGALKDFVRPRDL